MSFIDNALNFFQSGGVFMYPIALTFLLGCIIIIERYIFLLRTVESNRSDFDAILPLITKKNFEGANRYAQNANSFIASIVGTGLAQFNANAKKEDAQSMMEERLLEALPHIERRTGFLPMLANIATLLGLLGTIMGLIAAFTAVANADPAQKATLLSQSISIAMSTTAFGLMVAIPLLFIHAILQSKTDDVVESLEIAMVKIINHF